MPVSASYDEVGPIVGGRGGQLVRYRPVGIEHGLDADLDAVAAKVGLDVRKVRLCLRFQQVFGDFDERDVLGSLQEGQRALDRAARFAGVLPGNQDTAGTQRRVALRSNENGAASGQQHFSRVEAVQYVVRRGTAADDDEVRRSCFARDHFARKVEAPPPLGGQRSYAGNLAKALAQAVEPPP